MGNITQSKKVISSISAATREQIVKNLRYDKSIEAIIHHVEDAATGKYRVKYQDAIFKATAGNPKLKYYKGDNVLVTIPEGDFNNANKMITGLINITPSHFMSDSDGSSDSYNIVGKNLYKGKDISLSSYAKQPADKTVDLKPFLINENEVNLYLSEASHLLFKFKLKTDISKSQLKGTYSFGMQLKFSKEIVVDTPSAEIEEAETEEDEDTTLEDKKTEVVELLENYYFEPLNVVGYSLYNLDIPAQQSLLFKLPENESRKFLGVESFTASVRGFNEKDGAGKDIFFNNIEVYAVSQLPVEEIKKGYLTIETPDGVSFEKGGEEKLTLEAKFYLNEEKVNPKKEELEFYWFKEDADVSLNDDYYSKEGGAGWACLNTRIGKSSKDGEDGENLFKPETQKFELNKEVCSTKERKIKCAVKTKDGNLVVSSKPITIYDNDAKWTVEITSVKGKVFEKEKELSLAKGIGTILNCEVKLNNKKIEDYTNYKVKYNWSYEDNNGNLSSLSNTTKDFKIDRLIQDRKYICSVSVASSSSPNDYEKVGDGELFVYESTGVNEGYSILIENGTQFFKYDENGGKPNTDPLPLKIKMFKDGKGLTEGEMLEIIAAQKSEGEIDIGNDDKADDRILWKVPSTDSFLEVKSENGKNFKSIKKYYNVKRNFKKELVFDIADRYDSSLSRNQISVEVGLANGQTLTAQTCFTFVKQGGIGSNGTNEVCWIEEVIGNTSKKTGAFIQIESHPSIIGEGYDNEQEDSTGQKFFTLKGSGDNNNSSWSIFQGLQSNLGLGKVDATTGTLPVEYKNKNWLNSKGELTEISNIIQYKTNVGGHSCYYFLPVVVVKYLKTEWKDSGKIKLDENSGFYSVQYASNGKYPQYDKDNPFKLIITPPKNVKDENIKKYKVEWTGYSSSASNNFKIEPNKKNSRKATVFPPQTFNSVKSVYYLMATVKARTGNIIFARVLIPIYCYTNAYFNSDINEWDGSSVQMKDGSVLAPMVGAGMKHADNTFTGVVMGSRVDPSASNETGLFAYGNGERTVFIDAKTGKAEFGAAGGQIIIDPDAGKQGSTKKSVIKSGDYSTTNKTGMQIDLTTPEIRFGSGRFSVNEEGKLTAKGGGEIAGWSIGTKELSNGDRTGMCAAFHRFKKKNEEGTTNSEDALDKDGNLKTDYETNPNAEVVKLKIAGEEKYIAKAFWAGSKKDGDGDSNNSKFLVTHEGFLKAEECMLGSYGTNRVYIDCYPDPNESEKSYSIRSAGKIRCKDLYFPMKTEVGKDEDGKPIYELVDTSLVSILNKIPGIDIKQ